MRVDPRRDRRNVDRSVASGPHVMQGGEFEDPAQAGHAAGMGAGGADVIDELVRNQLAGVPDGIEHLAHRQRRGGVLADQAKTVLGFGGHRILHPEQPVGFEILAQPRRLDRCEPVVHVMQQMHIPAHGRAQRLEELRHMLQVARGRPDLFFGQFRRVCIAGMQRMHAVHGAQAGNAALRAHRRIAGRDLGADGGDGVFDGGAAGVGIGHQMPARRAAQQLIERHAGGLGLDVPQRHVDGGNRRHGHRSASPIGPAIEILPDLLDPARISAQQAGNDMIVQI